LDAPIQGRLLALPTNFRMVWKGLLGTNALAYLGSLSVMKKILITFVPQSCTFELFTVVIHAAV
jgi:hypothetical protein